MEIAKIKCSQYYKIIRAFYYLYIVPRKWQLRVQKMLRHKYYLLEEKKIYRKKKTVVCMIDGKVPHGGLSDRLMGIVSTYKLCRELGLEFKIYFIHPFILSDYLDVNNVDWRIQSQDISYNPIDCNPVYIDSIGGFGEKKLQQKWLKKELLKNYRQIHVYTNAHFAMDCSYSYLFTELFRPVQRIKSELDYHLQEIGNSYMCVTLRFQQLLGDFNEGNFPILNQGEQSKLITKCIDKINYLRSIYPNNIFLITSDSMTFLKKVNELDFVYVIPGTLLHMDYSSDSAWEAHKKAFVDFYMIANAKRIFLLRTDKMYKSHFPYSASLVSNTPYEIIEF